MDMSQALPRLSTGQAFRERVGFFLRATSGLTFVHIGKIDTSSAQFPEYNGSAIDVTLEIGGALSPKVVLAGVLAGDFLLTSKELTQVSDKGGKTKSSTLEAERLAAEALIFPLKDSGLNFGLFLGVTALLGNPFSSSSSSSASGVSCAGIQVGYDFNRTNTFSLTIQGHLGTTLATLKSGDLGVPMSATWGGLRVGGTYF